jgi:hypothetical protein
VKTGVWIALGVGIGTAIGVAQHNLPVWLFVGVAAGVIIAVFKGRRAAPGGIDDA